MINYFRLPNDTIRNRRWVTPLGGHDAMYLGLVVGGQQTLAVIDGWGLTASTLSREGDKEVDNSSTWRGPALLTDGRPADVTATVTPGSVRIDVERRRVIDWVGDPERLSVPPDQGVDRGDVLFIGGHFGYKFEELVLTPLTWPPPETPAFVQPEFSHSLRYTRKEWAELANTAGVLDLNGPLTVEAWVRWPERPDERLVFIAGDEVWRGMGGHPQWANLPGCGGWCLRTLRQGDFQWLEFAAAKPNDWLLAAGQVPWSDGWQHLAVSKTAESIRLFHNGRLIAGRAVSEPLVTSPTPMYLGPRRYGEHDRTLNAEIAAFRVSNTARYGEDFSPESAFESDEATLVNLDFSELEEVAATPEQQASELSTALNELTNWTVNSGQWSVAGIALHGQGDALLTFKEPLPELCTLSFKMRVDAGIRPRMHFGGLDIYFGNEGYSPNLFVYGPGASEVVGQPAAYEPGKPLDLRFDWQRDLFLFRLDGKLVCQGRRRGGTPFTLAIQAGDGFSLGDTQFSDFRIELPADPGSQGQLADVSGQAHHATLGGAFWIDLAHPEDSPIHAHDQAVAAILKRGGTVEIYEHAGRTVAKVNFMGTGVVDEDLAHLANLLHVRELFIGNTGITDAGMAHLAKVPELERLGLEGLGIGDAGLAHLADLKNLTAINLGYTKITSASLPIFSGWTTLQDLGLEGTRLSDADIPRLSSLTHLKGLILNHVPISERGHQRLLAALPAAKVDAGPFVASSMDLETAADTVRGLGGSFRIVEGAEGVRQVELDLTARPLDAEAINSLLGIAELHSLWLDETSIGEGALVQLKTLPRLKRLSLGGTDVADEELRHLAAVPGLEELNLGFTPVTDGGLAHLRTLTSLRKLNLFETEVTDAGAASLQKALPELVIERGKADDPPPEMPALEE